MFYPDITNKNNINKKFVKKTKKAHLSHKCMVRWLIHSFIIIYMSKQITIVIPIHPDELDLDIKNHVEDIEIKCVWVV